MATTIRCFKTGSPCTVDVQEKPRSVFVVMPFAEAFDDVYELGIKASEEGQPMPEPTTRARLVAVGV